MSDFVIRPMSTWGLINFTVRFDEKIGTHAFAEFEPYTVYVLCCVDRISRTTE